ncbi:MAG: aminopeptidase, partial [Alkalispirochaeta sp.]
FAAVAVGGLNVQRGQSLAIKMEPEQIDIASIVADEAYRQGVRYVDIWPESSRFLRSRIDMSAPDDLKYMPEYRIARNEEFLRDKWALLSLKAPVDLSVLSGIDAGRAGVLNGTVAQTDASLRRALAADHTQWLVMAPPAPAWASAILGVSDGENALTRMWELLVPILRLDAPDPVQFWRDYGAVLEERSARLDELAIATLRFEDTGTDLIVPLHERARWIGGGGMTRDGVRFNANIPSEEVFTAPYAPGVSGRVAVTRPVRVFGGLVKGGWFQFTDGEVTDFGADEGREFLDAFLSVDAGSRGIGEIALVDASSPIYRSGVVFQNILYDENAACHFALGSAYPTCLQGGADLSDEELVRLGSNRSAQHLDFMLGSDDIDVTATTRDGATVPVIRKGSFVL